VAPDSISPASDSSAQDGAESTSPVATTAAPGNPAPRGGGAPKRSTRWIVEWVAVLLVAILVAFLVRTFVAQTFYIPSASMEPTLQIGDRIIVDKLSYKIHGVGRGDIVVFKRPPAENCGGPPVPDLVKRVIGLPGETISSIGNTVLINGKPLAQPWLPKHDPLGQPISTITLGRNQYFMMGDNRSDSCDSRDWGPIQSSYIVGRVVLRIWPLGRLAFF
jgi:signal peptidase I